MKDKKLYKFIKDSDSGRYTLSYHANVGATIKKVSLSADKETGETRKALETRMLAYLVKKYGEPVEIK